MISGRYLIAALALSVLAGGCAGGARPVLSETTLPPAETVTTPPVPEVAEVAETAQPAQEPAATPTDPTDSVESAASCLNDRQWIGQTLMALVTQDQLGELTALAAAGEVGGLTLLGAPDASLTAALSALDTAGPYSLMMASDEEGGIVQRLAELINPLPAAATQSVRNTEDVKAEFAAYGVAMRELGFDIAFAPVLDIGGGPGIGSRSFSDDPNVVVRYAQATAAGFREGGILPVYKHFPGHGRASADSHDTLPVTPPYAELVGLDLLPYDALLSEPGAAVMVGHLSVPGLSDETPTSLSPNTITKLLRGEGGATFENKSYNFSGLVFSDALNMGAIANSYGTVDAAIRALVAGTDVLILTGPNDIAPVIDAVIAAIEQGRMTWAQIDDSALRVLAFKGVSGVSRCPA